MGRLPRGCGGKTMGDDFVDDNDVDNDDDDDPLLLASSAVVAVSI